MASKKTSTKFFGTLLRIYNKNVPARQESKKLTLNQPTAVPVRIRAGRTAITSKISARCYGTNNERQDFHFAVCIAVFRCWRLEALVGQQLAGRILADE